jgi:hypothetical protein
MGLPEHFLEVVGVPQRLILLPYNELAVAQGPKIYQKKAL